MLDLFKKSVLHGVDLLAPKVLVRLSNDLLHNTANPCLRVIHSRRTSLPTLWHLAPHPVISCYAGLLKGATRGSVQEMLPHLTTLLSQAMGVGLDSTEVCNFFLRSFSFRAESAAAFQLPCMSPLGYFLKVKNIYHVTPDFIKFLV